MPRNAVLFYDDYPTRGSPEFQITSEIARPLVVHVDQSGNPTGWMFDSIIVYSLYLYQDYNPSKAYVDSWIKYLFDGGQLANLDATVRDAKLALSQPDYQVNVFLTIPVSVPISLSQVLANTDSLLARWSAANLPNLRLVGLYWGFTENVEDIPDRDLADQQNFVRLVANHVHSRGLKLLMIPYANAPSDYLHGLGFDFVTMQPNYAFRSSNDISIFGYINQGIVAGNLDGFEFELPLAGDSSLKCCGEDWQVNLRTYLDQARMYNWQTKIATYYAGNFVSQMARSSNPDDRTGYEGVYDYILITQGKYTITLYARDAKTGTPVAGLSVYLDGNFSGDTDSNGRLSIKGTAPGLHQLLMNKDGYLSFTASIKLTTTKTSFIAIVKPAT
jgi:hypothetical protein